MLKLSTILFLLYMSANAAVTNVQRLDYIGNVKNIIIHTQKVRGGTYNFLNGSEFAQFGVFDERSKQKKSYKALNKRFKVSGKEIDAEFDKLRGYNSSLNKNAFQLDALTSFRAYGSLIKKMIASNKKLQVKFFDKAKPIQKSVSSVMVNDLISLSEALGKIRGLGSGVIAKSFSEDEEADMLTDYVKEVKKYLNVSLSNLQGLNNKYKNTYPKDFNVQLNELKKNINVYVKFVEHKLIDKSEINEDPNHYFDKGSQLITDVMKIYTLNDDILRKTF